MPSYRYLRDIEPAPEPPVPPQYTKKQKLQNWWHYHWKWVVAVVLLLGIGTYIVADALRTPSADITVGLVSPHTLPDSVLAGLQDGLSALAPDANGDGRQLAALESYTVQLLDGENDTADDPYTQMAGVTRLGSAIGSDDPLVFLLPAADAARYDEAYGLFGGRAYESTPWEESPALAALHLRYIGPNGAEADGQALFTGWCVVLRPLAATNLGGSEEGEARWAEAEALYRALTAGA